MDKRKNQPSNHVGAPVEPWNMIPPVARVSTSRHPASAIAAFVLAVSSGLAVGAAFAGDGVLFPPQGNTTSTEVAGATESPSMDVVEPSAAPDESVDPLVDASMPVEPDPTNGGGLLPPPPGGGDDDEGDDEGDDQGDDNGGKHHSGDHAGAGGGDDQGGDSDGEDEDEGEDD
ncbi:MAG: hypothetical protein WCJ78_04990 [Chloroflexota bacterium]